MNIVDKSQNIKQYY